MAKWNTQWKVTPHGPIEKLSDRVWRVEADVPGVPMKRVMTIAKRASGGVVIHNGIALGDPKMAQIEAFGRALDAYRLDVGGYPSTEQGLAALTTRPDGDTRWDGPYLQKAVPADPWGRPYQYRAPGQGGEFDLYSNGKDGQAGGDGDDLDISYR